VSRRNPARRQYSIICQARTAKWPACGTNGEPTLGPVSFRDNGAGRADATGLRSPVRKRIPLNTNRNNNNNRRRGRGNNRGQGGGSQGNRIDSRARGNAPQLLEKYRKLAHDASMNDDRVQTEYYLQFADHYFRVLADSRSPKDEGRGRRDFDRETSGDDEDEDEFEEVGRERFSRERPQDNSGERRSRTGEDAPLPAEEGTRGTEGEEELAEDANPFIRDTRSRRQRSRPRGKPSGEGQAAGEDSDASVQAASDGDSDDRGPAGVDPTVLPPSIGRNEGEAAAEEPPARPRATRGRPRKPRPVDNGDAETLEAVN
jgi:hypothetical protein